MKCPKNHESFFHICQYFVKLFPKQLILNSKQNIKEILQLKRLKEQKLIEMFFKLMEEQMKKKLFFDKAAQNII